MAPVPDQIVFKTYVPEKPLSEFVGLFWYWRGHDVSYSRERVLPTGTVELVIDLANGRASAAGLSGPRSQFFVIERRVQDELLGIHFKPGGAFPFLKAPLDELHNLNLSLADLWGEKNVGELIGLVHEAPTIDLKFQVLEKWLLLAANRPLQHHPAASFAVSEFRRTPGLLTSAEMAERVGFSQRRFIEIFRGEVGLTPKLFCRVQRFQQLISGIKNQDAIDWADAALSYGYYDQAHFIHDFQQFAGLTPTQYLGLRTDHLNHVKMQ